MEDSDTIFVLIPSYRDPELPHTLYSLFETAADSSRVFVGVYEQEDVDAPPLELSPRWRQQVRVHRVPWTLARGPCFARAEAAKLYAGERFVLYLDSHMRMAVHWDSLLLEQWRMCQSDRAILTTYPVGYEMGFEGGTRHWSDAKLDPNKRPPFLVFSGFGESDGMLRFSGKRLSNAPSRPLPCYFWVSGFSFSLASILKAVPYDPHLLFLFFGEETSMTVRLWTHGYDFFCPSVIVCYHLWRRSYRPLFREIKLPMDEERRLEGVARQRVRLLLQLLHSDACSDEVKLDLSAYSIGNVRSLDEYWLFCGVNLKTQTADERALLGGLPKSAFWEDPAKLVMQLLLQQQHQQQHQHQQQQVDAVAVLTERSSQRPSLEQVLAALKIETALNVWGYGSQVYRTVDEYSDWDFIVVVEETPPLYQGETMKLPTMDISVYSADQWRQRLADQDVSALECLWLEPEFVLLNKHDWLAEWKLDLSKLRSSVSARVGNSWVKANKKLTVPQDFSPRIAKKSLFHVFRILDFGFQIASDGKISNYSSRNDLWAAIMKDDSQEWSHYKAMYQKRYNEARSAFKSVAPK